MKKHFQSTRFANVTAMLALIVALGGTSYAAITLPRNSVGSSQIRSNAVGASEIKSGAVRSSEVKDGALLAKDFKAGQLPGGAQGPQGPQGAQGPQGPPGTPDGYTKTEADEKFIDTTEKAADSDKLDGNDSTAFMKGQGAVFANRISKEDEATDADGTTLFTVPGLGTLTGHCTTTDARIRFTNTSGSPVDVWRLTDTVNDWRALADNGTFDGLITSTNNFGDTGVWNIGQGTGVFTTKRSAQLTVSQVYHPTAANTTCRFEAVGTYREQPGINIQLPPIILP